MSSLAKAKMSISSPASTRNAAGLGRLASGALALRALSGCATDEGTRLASFEGDWLPATCTNIEDNNDCRTKPCDSGPFVLTVDSAGVLYATNYDVSPTPFTSQVLRGDEE